MNAPSTLPARLDGALLHIAIAIQSGNVFETADSLWEFARGKQRGNLARLPMGKRRRLVAPEKLETALKTGLHSIRPLLYPELMGDPMQAPRYVGKLCEDAMQLHQIGGVPIPFLLGNGTFCTIQDLTESGVISDDLSLIEFGGFDFTQGALLSSAYWAQVLEPDTLALVADAKSMMAEQSISLDRCEDFSQRVCVWGGRPGIFQKLKKRSKVPHLQQWFSYAATKDNPREVMTRGIDIPEMGVSFASKHLRFIDPCRYATFDSLLALAVGLPLNPEGYSEFLCRLKTIKDKHRLEDDIATIEMGIFSLIRPFFDAANLQPRTKESAVQDNMFRSISPSSLDLEFERLGAFSSSVTLYRRTGLPHIYGFANRLNHQDRRPMCLMLMLAEVPAQSFPTFQPELFSVNHPALRPMYALEYLIWWLKTHLGQHVLAFSIDPARHSLLDVI